MQLSLTGPEHEADAAEQGGAFTPMRTLGLATAVVSVVALGLYIGREIRVRYKFRRRTPADFFSNAGDSMHGAEYGMGV